MTTEEYKSELVKYLEQIKDQEESLRQIAKDLMEYSDNLGTIYIVGNGGSASTAQHFAQGLLDQGVRAVCLMDNISNLTARSNDLSYKDALKETLRRIAHKDSDVIVVISGSGNSRNLIELVELDIPLIGILGMEGGKLAEFCYRLIVLSGKWYGPLEDAHLVVCHIICELIKERNG